MDKTDRRNTTLVATAVAVGFIAVIAAVAVLVSLSKSGVLVWDRGKAVSVPRLLKPVEVQLDELPAIVNAMSHGTAKVRWAALTFSTPDRPSDDDAVNLNLSFEDGKVGFDWVFLAPRNREDEEKFKMFARAHGVEVVSRSMNGVSYLRAECRDVVKFTASIVTEMYSLPPTEPLELFHQGFEWPRR